jgi:hypothetical protein
VPAIDQLFTMAEIGAAFMGFTAIVGVVVRAVGRSALPKINFWFLMEFSLASIFFSLLPVGILNFAVEPKTVWTICSSIAAVFMIVHLSLVARHVGPAIQAAGGIFLWGPRIVPALIGTVTIIQILNATGVYFHQDYPAYFITLVWFLLVASINLIMLLAQVWSQDA